MSHKRRIPNEKIRRARQLVSGESLAIIEAIANPCDTPANQAGNLTINGHATEIEENRPSATIHEVIDGAHEVVVNDQLKATCVSGIGARALTTMCQFTSR